MGAVDIVVPGVLPIGCFPLYLTLFQSSNPGNYDQNGCLKNFNSLSSYHNSLLMQTISNLRGKYPGARIMYADFYNQVQQMVQSPQSFGQLSVFTFFFSFFICCYLFLSHKAFILQIFASEIFYHMLFSREVLIWKIYIIFS